MTDTLTSTPMWLRPRAGGLYDISTAAQLLGVHPQTLRFYERRGLIDPARSPGGQRRYSCEHLAQLANIHSLSGEGFNLAAIQRIIQLEAEIRVLRRALAAAGTETSRAACRSRQGSRIDSAEQQEVTVR